MILLSYFFVQPITIYESLFPLEEIMKEELVAACSRPTPEIEQQEPEVQFVTEPVFKGARPMIQIGRKAPDFTAPAYFNGKFTSVKLSDYLGQWVVLCFYPGDFTFV